MYTNKKYRPLSGSLSLKCQNITLNYNYKQNILLDKKKNDLSGDPFLKVCNLCLVSKKKHLEKFE